MDKGRGVPHQAVQIQAQVHQVQEDVTWETLLLASYVDVAAWLLCFTPFWFPRE